ncbi:hypothetical protein DOJK_02114, partial [Patescibacteria group bacterium]
SLEELIAQEVWKVVHPDDLRMVKSRISEIFNKKLENANLEFRKVKKDGTSIWVNESTRLIEDDKGVPKELFIICRDITKNKEFQLALLESEKKYRNLTQNAPVSVARFSMLTNDFEYANDEFARQMGCSVEEYSGLSRKEKKLIIHPEDSGKVASNYDKWKHEGFKGILHFDYRIINRKKELIWLDTFIYADFDSSGKAVMMNEVCIDITERKKAELAIIESEKKYKNLATTAPIAVTKISSDTLKYEYVNAEFTRQTGYTMEEYNALSKEEIKAMAYPEDKKRVSEFFKKWKQDGFKGTQHIDYRTYNRNGEVIWVDTFLFADFSEEGKLLAINQICIDITDQKSSQEKIVESENKYKKLAANSPVAVTRIDLKTKSYDFVNDEFVRQSGYSMEEFNALEDQKLFEMIHAEDRHRVSSFYIEWERQKYRGTQHIDYRIVNRYKKEVWLDTYLYAEFDSNGAPNYINQVCIDITDQKKTEDALREKDRRFRSLIENITEMISLVDSSGEIIYASPSVTSILGYDAEEFESKNIFDFINEEDSEEAKESFRKVLEKPGNIINNIQFRFRNRKGDWVWSEATAHNLINDPSIGGIVFNYRDITDRRKAEEEIRLQKSYFQQLFENSPEGIVILDNQDRIVDANKGFERMFQFSADEIRGKDLNSIIVPESLLEQATQMTLFVLRGEVIHRETERKRKDGSTVDVSILAYPIVLGENQ